MMVCQLCFQQLPTGLLQKHLRNIHSINQKVAATNGRLTNGGYYVPENHVIVHVRGGIVRETDEPTGIVVEVWNHDECAADKGTRDNCPSCHKSLKP